MRGGVVDRVRERRSAEFREKFLGLKHDTSLFFFLGLKHHTSLGVSDRLTFERLNTPLGVCTCIYVLLLLMFYK